LILFDSHTDIITINCMIFYLHTLRDPTTPSSPAPPAPLGDGGKSHDIPFRPCYASTKAWRTNVKKLFIVKVEPGHILLLTDLFTYNIATCCLVLLLAHSSLEQHATWYFRYPLPIISQFVSLSHEKRQLGYVFESRENPRNMYTKNAGKCPATVHWYEA
jgi:hypothetical protein